MTENKKKRNHDSGFIPLTRISWEPDVTKKLELWIDQTAKGHYQDFTPQLENFFEKKLNRPCIAVSSGTAALHLALRLLRLQPGTEIIIPTLTYAACANTVLYEGLTPVFCDVHPETWCLDAECLKDVIESRKKSGATIGAVMPVHLYGQVCGLEGIQRVCKYYDICIIEDVAQGLGGMNRSKSLGTEGSYSCFSFNASKIITGFGGGLLGLQNINEKKIVRNAIRHGRIPFESGLPQYNHPEIGFNYQISGYSAALIQFQLPHLSSRLGKKKVIFENYRKNLGNKYHLEYQNDASNMSHARWMSCFRLMHKSLNELDRDKLCRSLAQYGIETRPVFKPLHEQPAYDQAVYMGGQIAETIANSGICFPSSCDLTEEEQMQVIHSICNISC